MIEVRETDGQITEGLLRGIAYAGTLEVGDPGTDCGIYVTAVAEPRERIGGGSCSEFLDSGGELAGAPVYLLLQFTCIFQLLLFAGALEQVNTISQCESKEDAFHGRARLRGVMSEHGQRKNAQVHQDVDDIAHQQRGPRQQEESARSISPGGCHESYGGVDQAESKSDN